MELISKIFRAFRTLARCLRPIALHRIGRTLLDFLEDSVIPFGRLTVGSNTNIHPTVNFKSPENIQVGNRVRIQPQVLLWASPRSKIVIGDLSGIGPGTKIFSSNHRYCFGKTYIDQPWVEKDVVIGRNVWIGANCLITAGVSIGDGAVVGAGSVVTRDVPACCLAVGNPAQVVKDGQAHGD